MEEMCQISEIVDKVDHVKEYARKLLSLGLLYMEFTDAIEEGDAGGACSLYLKN